MKPGPAATADWVEAHFELSAEPTDLADVIVLVGTADGWFRSPEEAAEKAEAWKKRLANRLATLLSASREDNRPSRFDFNSSAEFTIQGICFVSASEDDGDAIEAKRARALSDHYRDQIRSMDDRDFEAICRGVLSLLGCVSPTLTAKSGDQGIDVFGEIPMNGRLGHNYLLGGPDALMTAWIAGQAKKYTIPVEVADIHQFVGAYEMARKGIFHGDGGTIQAFTPLPYQPVWLFFFTTGKLTRGAWQLARRGGMIVLDEATIAALLADRKIATVAGLYWQTRFSAWTSGQVAQ